MSKPAFLVAGQQIAGIAAGLRRRTPDDFEASQQQEVALALAAVLETVAEIVGGGGGDVPEVGPVTEIPIRVAVALEGARVRDGISHKVAKRLLSRAFDLEQDGADDYEVALGATLRLVAEVAGATLGAPSDYGFEDYPKAVREILASKST